LWLARINPFHNLFYEAVFQKIVYNNDIPEPVNLFDKDGNIKLHKFLLNKFTDWYYETEYRMIVDPDVDKMLLSEEEFKRGLVKYQKEDLEGIIFGLKINRKDAQDVYDTIKKHYLDEGITVNFRKAVEIGREYDLKIESISNIDEYIKSRPESGTGPVSSPGEFHPQALSEPDLNLSIHPAPIIQPLGPCFVHWFLPCCQG